MQWKEKKFVLNASPLQRSGGQLCSSSEAVQKHHQECFHCETYTLPHPDAERAAVVAVTRCTGIARPASLSLAASSLFLVSRATVHS